MKGRSFEAMLRGSEKQLKLNWLIKAFSDEK